MLPVFEPRWGGRLDWGKGLTEEEFWSFTTPEPNTGCLAWNGPLANQDGGYTMAKFRGRRFHVHRIAVWIATGKRPRSGLQFNVRHSCDNKWCVNPAHLFAGTAKQNSRDMWRKGRGGHRHLRTVFVGNGYVRPAAHDERLRESSQQGVSDVLHDLSVDGSKNPVTGKQGANV